LLRGVTNLNLDEKGRMAIPSRYRASLSESCEGHLVITVDKSQCLLVYPLPDWEDVEKKLTRLSSINKQTRSLQRFLTGHATDVDMDASGRVLVPAPLRKYAHIEKQVVLAGQGNKFELWDEQKWNQSCEDWMNEEELKQEDIPEELQNFSL